MKMKLMMLKETKEPVPCATKYSITEKMLNVMSKWIMKELIDSNALTEAEHLLLKLLWIITLRSNI